jgi:hypothetical protein
MIPICQPGSHVFPVLSSSGEAGYDARSYSKVQFVVSRELLQGQHTTCDPTWRPMIVYIATIFAVLECLTGRAVADEKSMDGVAWSRG